MTNTKSNTLIAVPDDFTFTEAAHYLKSRKTNRRSEPRLAWDEGTDCVWIDGEGTRHCERVQLLNCSDKGLGFQCSDRLNVGQTVWVELDSEICRAVVRFCKKDSDGYRTGLLRIRRERRRADRVPIGGSGMLQWAAISTPVMIRNVNPDGLQVETAIKVPLSTVVRLSGSTLECLAITRYCRPAEDHYLVGLELLRPPWDQDAGD